MGFTYSKETYKKILLLSKSMKYQAIRFRDIDVNQNSDKLLLIRHDIDVSLKYAMDMARLESENSVQSTYFVMLRSPAYNLFSRDAFKRLREIQEFGHEIGLHFDAAHPYVVNKDLAECVQKEKDILSDLVQAEIGSLSFHQPSREVLENDIFLDGLINTYNNRQMLGWYYLSDSNRVWKEHDGFSVFEAEKYDQIQMLIHPIWWMCELPNIIDVWNEAIATNFDGMQEQFLATERAYGPKRKFTIS